MAFAELDPQRAPRRVIVAITGATGTIFGVRLLEMLRDTGVETHLVISRWGAHTLLEETSYTVERVQALATEVYAIGELRVMSQREPTWTYR